MLYLKRALDDIRGADGVGVDAVQQRQDAGLRPVPHVDLRLRHAERCREMERGCSDDHAHHRATPVPRGPAGEDTDRDQRQQREDAASGFIPERAMQRRRDETDRRHDEQHAAGLRQPRHRARVIDAPHGARRDGKACDDDRQSEEQADGTAKG